MRFHAPKHTNELSFYKDLAHQQSAEDNNMTPPQENSISTHSQIDSNQNKVEEKEISIQKKRIFQAVLLKRKQQQRLLNNNGLFINTQSRIDTYPAKEQEMNSDLFPKNNMRTALRLDE